MLFSSQIIDNYRLVINELMTCDFTPVIDYLKCLEFTRVNSGSSTGRSEFENKERVCTMECMCWRLWSDHDHQEAEKQFGGFKISMNITNEAIVWKCACLCDQRKKATNLDYPLVTFCQNCWRGSLGSRCLGSFERGLSFPAWKAAAFL